MSQTTTVKSETELRDGLAQVQRIALIVGGVGLAITFIGSFVMGANQFFQSYLVGTMFWTQLSLGCLLILMVHLLAGGPWSAVIHRITESGAIVVGVMGVLFLPMLLTFFFSHPIYEWADPSIVANDPIIQHKAIWLNIPGFILRMFIFFGIWIGMAYFLSQGSLKYDKTGDMEDWYKMQYIVGPGVLVFGLATTFASVDWMMSLEPHWFSHIYGVMYVVGSGICAFAFIVLLMNILRHYEPFASVLHTQHINDYGNFLMGGVMVWAYVQLAQGLIIWSGNVAELTPWYLYRTANGWEYLYAFVVAFHFVVPFLLLILRPIKRNIVALGIIAALIFVMRFADLTLLVAPAPIFHPDHLSTFATGVDILDVTAWIGIGGLWIAAFSYVFRQKPTFFLVHDSRVSKKEHAHHGAHQPA